MSKSAQSCDKEFEVDAHAEGEESQQETVGIHRDHGFHTPVAGPFYEKCEHDRPRARITEGFAKGSDVGYADAYVFHQSSRARAERSPAG
jgi:hypothetical protein